MASIEKLGAYIERLDRPNSNLLYGIEDVCGITNTKQLVLGTKANLIGRTFEKFSILSPREFIFNRRTSRNGERISLGFNATNRDWILTEDYCHFRIRKDKEDVLDPEFLYLFFLDPEFDRYARFNSWGSATEFFNWEEIIDTPVPILPLSEQRKIVHNYQVIRDRIDLLRKININLEEQMTILFKDKILDNTYYVFDEHIDEKIDFVNGLAMQDFRPLKGEVPMPVIKIRELTQGYCDENSEYCSPSIDLSRIIDTGDLVFSWSGSIRLAFWASSKAGLNQHLFKVTSSVYPNWFIYLWTKHYLKDYQHIAENKGTTFGHIKREDLHASMIKSLNEDAINRLSEIFEPLQRMILGLEKEIQLLFALEKKCLEKTKGA